MRGEFKLWTVDKGAGAPKIGFSLTYLEEKCDDYSTRIFMVGGGIDD